MADDYTPDENEEFEFRARAEQEARAGQAQAPYQPDTQDAAPAGPVEPSTGEKIIGGLQTAAQAAEQHPVLAGGAALVGGKVLSKVPGVAPLVNAVGRTVVPGYTMAGNAINAANQFVSNYGERTAASQFNTLLHNYTGMMRDARQYEKAGQPVPEELKNAIGKLGQQIQFQQSKIPTAPAAQALEQPGMLERAAQLYNRYAPQMAGRLGQAAEAMAPVGRVLAPVANVAAKIGGVGGQALFHSANLNSNEDQILAQLRAASSQPNPSAVNSGFTQELSAMEQNRKRQ